MNFELTKERLDYLSARGRVVLNACPGSGKTTAIAFKLAALVKDWKNSGGVACLSFTNNAKDEILNKFRSINGFPLTYPHFNGTIDSFINRNITLPYAHKIISTDKRFRIIDDEAILERLFDWSFMKKYTELFYTYSPAKICFINKTKVLWNGHDMSNRSDFYEYSKAAKRYQWKKGILTTGDSLYLALRILNSYPRIAKYLAIRFPHIIVDEAQDTSETQYEVFEQLLNSGLENFELVGDPYQCLYEWRDASPSSFLKRFDDSVKYASLTFTKNRRSTKNIVNTYIGLRRKSDEGIITKQATSDDHPLHIFKYKLSYLETLSPYTSLCNKLTLSKYAVLVRGTAHMNEYYGVNKAFNPWKSMIPYYLIQAKKRLNEKNIREAIKIMRRLFASLVSEDFHLIKALEDEIENDCNTNAQLFDALRRIPDFSINVNDWTNLTQEFIKDVFGSKDEINFQIKKSGFKRSLLNETMAFHFLTENEHKTIPVHTIHHVKGMTFQSVLIVLGERNHAEILTFKDFEKIQDMPNEKQRMLYVGMSRPEKLLCLAVPDSIDNELLYDKFGSAIIIYKSDSNSCSNALN